jgi:flagellar FliJ protein
MKKFQFRLATVQKYKQTLEKEQKAELATAMNALRELEARLSHLEAAIALGYKGAATVSDLEHHAAWLERLRDERKALLPLISAAQDRVEQCRERLIQTMKELKTYQKLRDEQYAEWQRESTVAERSELEDYIAVTLV